MYIYHSLTILIYFDTNWLDTVLLVSLLITTLVYFF